MREVVSIAELLSEDLLQRKRCMSVAFKVSNFNFYQMSNKAAEVAHEV
jgi:hypothetical protein